MTAHFTPEQKLAQVQYLLFRMQRESKANKAEINRAIGFCDDLKQHLKNVGKPCELTQLSQSSE